MSAELHDVRGKVTTLGYCALLAHHRAYGDDISEILRDVVEEWARRQVHAATLLTSCMKSKGITAADAGIAGKSLDWSDE